MKLISSKDSTRFLRHLDQARCAILSDPSGNPAAYLLDSKTFLAMQARIRLLEGIARGEKAVEEGRVLTHVQAKKKLARWLKKP